MPPAAEAAADFGYWGIPTATIDWCEENYEVTTYIAEFWNTVTNLWMILPPLHGLYCVYKNKFEKRFYLVNLTLLSIGVGSWLFHMTLRYDMQLMDEVPMVFGSAAIIYCIYQTRQPKGVLNAYLAFFLLAYCITFLVVYLYIKDPLFQEWMYGLLVTLMIGLDLHLTLTQRSKVGDRMFLIGVSIYLLGFFLWNVDNMFCPTVKRLRSESPAALRPLTQLHGWWHACAGYATYMQIVVVIHHRQKFLGEKCHYEFSPLVGITVSRKSEQLEVAEAGERLEKMKKAE